MDCVAGRGADRRVAVIEESGDVLWLVITGDHELDAMAGKETPSIGHERDPVIDRFADWDCLGLAAREDRGTGPALGRVDFAEGCP